MQLIDGQPVYSATDLVGFLACEHLTNLERAALGGPRRSGRSARTRSSTSIAKRGIEHEQRYPRRPAARPGATVAEIDPDGRSAARERLRPPRTTR